MFTTDTLQTLSRHQATPKVSLFLPASPSGSETLEAPKHLAALLAEARTHLIADGVSESDADSILAPVQQKVADSVYWQHQEEGLALFVSCEGLVEVSVST